MSTGYEVLQHSFLACHDIWIYRGNWQQGSHLGVWTYQCFRSCTRYGSISKRWRRLDFFWTVLGQVREFNVGLGLSAARQCGARVFQDFKDFVRCSKTIWRRRANVVAFPYCCRVAKHATCFLLSRQSQLLSEKPRQRTRGKQNCSIVGASFKTMFFRLLDARSWLY